MHISEIQERLTKATREALNKIPEASSVEIPSNLTIELEIPKDQKHGDLTTNVAMRLAKSFRKQGVWVATRLKEELWKNGTFYDKLLAKTIDEVHVSPPGFINFRLKKEYIYNSLQDITKEKGNFGKSNLGRGEKVNIEFVSTNPTGPLTIAHGRQAAVGDSLARILKFAGYDVSKEYFINDVGTQIELLGKSIYARYLALNGIEYKFPEDGYRGEYIKDIAEELNKKYGKKFIDEKHVPFI